MLEVYDFVRAVRDRKGMLIDTANRTADSRSAGSFFKNPLISGGRRFEGMLRGAWVVGGRGVSALGAGRPGGGEAGGGRGLIERAGIREGICIGSGGDFRRNIRWRW